MSEDEVDLTEATTAPLQEAVARAKNETEYDALDVCGLTYE